MSDEQPVVNEHATPVAFFRLPEYVEAFGKSLAEAMNGLARSKAPILAKTPRVRTHRMYRGRNSLESSAGSETMIRRSWRRERTTA